MRDVDTEELPGGFEWKSIPLALTPDPPDPPSPFLHTAQQPASNSVQTAVTPHPGNQFQQ